MAKYRQIFTEFWSDSFVIDLQPDERYFYLYIISNTKSTQSGIYEISPKYIATELGYSKDYVEELIKRFCDFGKILYNKDTKEIMILNWIKYNSPNNINSVLGVQKELKRVKSKEFIKVLFDICKAAQLDVKKIFEDFIVEECIGKNTNLDKNLEDDKITEEIPLGSPSIAPCIEHGTNRIRSKEQEVKNNEQGLKNKEEAVMIKEAQVIIKEAQVIIKGEDEIKNVIKVFEENIHVISPIVQEIILAFTKQVSSKIIIMAINEAVSYNVKTIIYISKVLNNWINNDVKTESQVIAYQKQWINKKDKKTGKNVKQGGFCDYEQRQYDFDILEKQLLGQL
ncbi:DnaD domain-containing protein [Clostridium lacusfryxellense]|uniref:DnaD domain-containing protein n=1 Tax=Clostridium lacusfryxellense TaxID=205328 RepID=UPI001C0B2426|nr:DnaD domain protein [Clostridium lacusfryxellense]MBU3112671.1 DnaD domain protein [Clostridium lacusfryxellense]